MAKFKILNYQNYLETIKASRGCKMFRRFYVLEDGKKRDILKNGKLSCARYVSSILKLFDLISETHATVSGTTKDMLKNGWKPTGKLVPGNVLIWEEKTTSSNEKHLHNGFYIGDEKAISNSSKEDIPVAHHFTYGKNKKNEPKRKIVQILTHKIIN